ncbi:MAG: hypothetical protein Q7R51_00560 [bacterium]|nr:hypothetical protein [bacterium]
MNDIDKKLAAIGKAIATIKENMATKSDLKGFAKRTDLDRFATKDDLKGMATKSDLKNLETRLTGDMKGLEIGLKGDFEIGLKGLEKRLTERFDESQMEIVAAVDKNKADKDDVKVLKEKVDRLEDNAGLPPYPNQ